MSRNLDEGFMETETLQKRNPVWRSPEGLLGQETALLVPIPQHG